jgi:hypothetical protein
MQTTKMKVSDYSGFFSQRHTTASLNSLRLRQRFEAEAGAMECGELTASTGPFGHTNAGSSSGHPGNWNNTVIVHF